MRNVTGVTLVEMLFGLAIVAILAGLAVPGFRQTLRAAAIRGATFELLAGLQQARGHSILESQPGLLCPSDSTGNCLPPATAGAYWRWSLETPGQAPDPRRVLSVLTHDMTCSLVPARPRPAVETTGWAPTCRRPGVVAVSMMNRRSGPV